MKNKKTRIKFILACGVIAILSAIIININNKNNLNKQKSGDYMFNVAGIQISATDSVFGEANTPQLGAGMIPIKYENGTWEIIDISENSNPGWYDYSSGKMATVMLSDGYYISEVRDNMDGHALSYENIGKPVPQEQLGTIFIWLPRMIKIGIEDYRFLKDYSIVNYDDYSTPDCFSYLKDGLVEYAFKGVWLEKNPNSTEAETSTIISAMKKEENKYGLIKNELVDTYTGEARDAADIYQGKFKVPKQEQQLAEVENINRVMIRIFNTNGYVPLNIKAKSIEKVAYITAYSEYGIDKILYVDMDLDTEEEFATELEVVDNVATMPVPKNGIYNFTAIDNVGNIQSYVLKTAIGIPDLTGFRVDSTYIVTYSNEMDASTIDTSIPIKDILVKGYKVDKQTNALIKGEINLKKIQNLENEWFNYEDSKWANIVTRNNGSEAYFTWIPRYVYKLNTAEETTQIRFVSTENQDNDGQEMNLKEWTLPESFTWWDANGNAVPTQGFWVTKYELSGKTTFSFSADVFGGLEKVIVNNIVNNTGLPNCTYDFYVYKDGVDKTKLEDETIMKDWRVAYIKNKTDYTFTNIPKGTYQVRIVLNSNGHYMGEIWRTNITVDVKGIPNEPDLTGFKINTTYVVAYNDSNTINEQVPISQVLKDVEIDKDLSENSVLSAKVDVDKVNEIFNDNGYVWYDYDNSKWANIAVRNGGGITYYTWIPRYVYRTNTNNGVNATAIPNYETTEIKFIGKDEEIPTGWILPESFTWKSDKGTEQLNGFWTTKYELTSYTNFNLKVADDSGLIGEMNRVRINNISNNLGLNNYRIFLYESSKIAEYEQSHDIKTGFYKYYAEGVDTPPTETDEYGVYICDGKNFVRYAQIKSNGGVNQTTFYNLNADTYTLRIVAYDDSWRYRGESWYYNIYVVDKAVLDDTIQVDLNGFRLNTTYVVAYNSSGTMTETVPISNILKDVVIDTSLSENTMLTGEVDTNKVKEIFNDNGYVWYDYDNSKWANIVTRNAGGITYYTWIPRYAYKVDNIREESMILFLKPDDPVPTGWSLPESFKWTSDSGTNQLNGFWTTKYELTSFANFNLKVADDSGLIGEMNRIRINNISNNIGLNHYRVFLYESSKLAEYEESHNIKSGFYKYYAEGVDTPPTEKDQYGVYICDGKNFVRYIDVESNKGVNQTTFYNLNADTYTLRIVAYDDSWRYRGESWYYNIYVVDKADPAEVVDIDLTGFKLDTTYAVVYNASGAEIRVPIKNVLSSYETNEQGAITSATVDKSKAKSLNGYVWYDYDDSKWANIVTVNNGKTAYFVWTPRYAYKIDNIRETTMILFQKTTDTVPTGWTLPDSFAWWNEANEKVQISGFWTTKYELS